MATPDQIRAAAAGYASADDAAAKRLRDAQALVFGQAAQQVGSARQAQQVAPQLVQAGTEQELKSAQDSAQTQVQAGELANTAEQQASQQALDTQATGQALQQAKSASAQQTAEAVAEAAQRKQMTADEQASAGRLQQVGLAYDSNLAFMSLKQRDDLAKLGRDVKDKLFTERLAFEHDEAGRKFSNERQLADYTVANAKSQDELKDKVQTMQQAQQNKEYMVSHAFDVALTNLDEQYRKAEQAKDEASQARIAETVRRLKKEQVKRAAKAGSMSAGVQGAVGGAATGAAVGSVVPGIGTVIGAVAGGLIGGVGAYYAASQG